MYQHCIIWTLRCGKSFVIGKAKNSYSAKNWITVSLASFDNSQKDNVAYGSSGEVKLGNEDNANRDPAKLINTQSVTENNIETEVLRQIVYKIDAKKTPRSRLKAIRDQSGKKSIGIGAYLALCATAVFLLCFFFSTPLSEVGWVPRIITLIICAILITTGVALSLIIAYSQSYSKD